MSSLDLRSDVHRRLNPLTGDWVLVSPHRAARPWQGHVDTTPVESIAEFDPACYMCPGNVRANGQANPAYRSVFVFDNDFPALRPDTTRDSFSDHELLVATGEPGICRVVCFSPRHDLTLARMSRSEIRQVIDVWTGQAAEIAQTPGIQYVQVFENRGAIMGASNPHPHCQIWATAHLPNEVMKEHANLQRHFDGYGSDLLGDYLAIEQQRGERMVCENAHFTALVPFWALWPFETMLIAKHRVTDFSELTDAGRDGLADLLKRLLTRYDNLFESSCAYSMGFHLRPAHMADARHWRLHAHVYPPVLRSATIRKFMVGYEMLGTPQRDLTPEGAAERLRSLPDRHYREGTQGVRLRADS
jgi:UDPglucose--hexose-1-phosphate uridylyltransferase